eukprot:jgi/Galph1/6038/GphlegSOOS_G4654.1
METQEDDPVLVRRALARETTIKNLSKRLSNLYILWYRSKKENNVDPNELLSVQNLVLKELSRYQLNLRKLALVSETTLEEDHHLETLEQQLIQESKDMQVQVEQLKTQLECERKQRRRKEEYSLLAASVMKLADREKLQGEIRTLQEELGALEEQKRQVAIEKEQRAKQFQLLLQSINELSSSLESQDDWFSWWKQWFIDSKPNVAVNENNGTLSLDTNTEAMEMEES